MSASTVLLHTFIIDPSWGSEEGLAHRWVLLYLQSGWRVHLLHHRDPRGGSERAREAFATEIADGRVRMTECPTPPLMRRFPYKPPFFYPFYRRYLAAVAKRVEQLCAAGEVDLFHHLNYTGFRVPVPIGRLPVPTIWGPISGLQSSEPMLVSLLPVADRIKEWVRNSGNRYDRSVALAPRQALRRYRAVLAANSDALRWCQERGRRDATLLVETAVDERFFTEPLPLSERRGLLWVGNYEARKLPELAIVAYALLRRRGYPEPLEMVGFDQDRWHLLQAWAEARGYPTEGVVHVGKIPRAELPERYRRSRLFWFTSLRDTSGNVAIEALCSGTPVVAFDQHGIGDFFAGGAGGAAVPLGRNLSRTVERWVAASLPLLQNEAAWAQQSRRARTFAEREMTWAVRRDQFAAVLAGMGLSAEERCSGAGP